MLTKEEQELVLRVTGVADIQKARNAIQEEEKAIRQATDALKAGASSQAQWEYATRTATATILKQQAAIKALDGQTRAYNQNITALGYGLNDFFSVSGGLDQRLNSIANNLPGMLAGFGNIGLILSAVTPIVAVAVRNWDAIAKALGMTQVEVDKTGISIKALHDKIEELNKKPIKLAVDMLGLDQAQAKIDKLHKDKESFDAMGELRSEDQVAAGSRLTKEIGETGEAAQIKTEIQELLVAEAAGKDKLLSQLQTKIKAAQQEARDFLALGGMEQAAAASGKIKTLEQEAAKRGVEIREKAGLATGELFGEAGKGTSAAHRERLADMIHLTGREGLASRVLSASPEQMKADRIAAQVSESNVLEEKTNKGAKKAYEAKIDELNETGGENATAGKAAKLAADRAGAEKTGKALEGMTKEAPGVTAFKAAAAKKGDEIAGATDIDERASAEASLLRAGKGSKKFDRDFNVIPLKPEEQRKRLQKMILEELKRVAPGLGPNQAGAISANMTKNAFQEAEETTKGVLGGAHELAEGGADLLKQIQLNGAQAVAIQRQAAARQAEIQRILRGINKGQVDMMRSIQQTESSLLGDNN